MPRIVTTPTTAKDGRLKLVEDDGTTIGFGHLEIPYVPPGNEGAILGDVQFVLEPRAADLTNEQLMTKAHGG